MKIYGFPLSPFVRKVMVVAQEKGIDAEIVPANPAHPTEEFLAASPYGKIPAMDDEGFCLADSSAIAHYLDAKHPDPALLPADPKEEIKAISLMGWFGSGIHPHLTPNARPQNYCDLPGSEDSVKRVARKLLFEDLKIADERLADREFFFQHFTACDAYFFWCVRRALSFKIDLSSFANCMAHFERIQQRPSVQKVIAHEKQVMEAFAKAA